MSSMPRRLALGTLVFAGSVYTFVHYLGAASIVLAVAWAAIAAVTIDAVARVAAWRWTARCLIALALVAVAAFAVVYPRVDVDELARSGVDRDDDADAAVIAAWHGDYPFAPKTYLGNDITHMPGSLLVAAPFVAVGGSALENLAVLPLGVWLLARRTRSAETMILVVGTAAASAGVWHEFLTGGNSLAEWTLLSLAAVWIADRATSPMRAVAFGFALNVRANVWCAGAAAVGTASRASWRGAVRVALIVGAVQAVLVGPFLLGGPERFTPITGGTEKFFYFDSVFAHASTVVPMVAAVVGAIVAFVVARSRRLVPAAGALAALGLSQLSQFGFLMLGAYVAAQPEWVEIWSSYLTLAVIPGACAVALSYRPPHDDCDAIREGEGERRRRVRRLLRDPGVR